MDVLIKASQFLLSLSFLIVLHELGHFLPAKWFKTRVEKFYLFFDFAPWRSLWKKKVGETEYGIGWLPLGGYVKISGMIDESMDTEAMKSEPQPWEFRSKPAWQRLIIMIGGVTVNFILGFAIFGMMLWVWGKSYIPTASLKDGIAFDSIMIKQGFRQGDRILRLGDQPFDRLDDNAFRKAVILRQVREATVLRDGKEERVTMGEDIVNQVSGARRVDLMAPRIPFVIERTLPKKPASMVNLQKGDKIIAFNDKPLAFYDEFGPTARQHKGQTVRLGIVRGADTLQQSITIGDDGLIGAAPQFEPFVVQEREKYSFAAAIPEGVRTGWRFLKDQLTAFGMMFSGALSAKENLGSLISIGNMFPSYWDWEIFWNITASLSIILAFMNLLPIPALDGGYVVFLIWEVITGRKVSDKVMEYAVTVGFFLLMGLMIFAFGLDIWRHLLQKWF